MCLTCMLLWLWMLCWQYQDLLFSTPLSRIILERLVITWLLPKFADLCGTGRLLYFTGHKMHRILEGSFRNKIFHTRLKLSFTAVHTKFALVMELPKIFSTAVTLSSYYCSCPDFHCIQTESSSVPSGTLLIPRFLKDITAVSHFTACAFSCVCNTKLSQQSQWCHWQPPRFSLQKLSFL
jgi:hypothetical protein